MSIKFASPTSVDPIFHDTLVARASSFIEALPLLDYQGYDLELTYYVRKNVFSYLDYLKKIRCDNASISSKQIRLQKDPVTSISSLIPEHYDPNTNYNEKEVIMIVYYDTYKAQIQAYNQLIDFLSVDPRFPIVLASQLERLTARMEALCIQYSVILRCNKTLDGLFNALIQQGRNLLEQVRNFEQRATGSVSPVITFALQPEQSTNLLSRREKCVITSMQSESLAAKKEINETSSNKIRQKQSSPLDNLASENTDGNKENTDASVKVKDTINKQREDLELDEPQEELTLAQLGPDADVWNDVTKREIFYASDEELDDGWKPTKKPRYIKQSTRIPTKDILKMLKANRAETRSPRNKTRVHAKPPPTPLMKFEKFIKEPAPELAKSNVKIPNGQADKELVSRESPTVTKRPNSNSKPENIMNFDNTPSIFEFPRSPARSKTLSEMLVKSNKPDELLAKKQQFASGNRHLGPLDNNTLEKAATSSATNQLSTKLSATNEIVEKSSENMIKKKPKLRKSDSNGESSKSEPVFLSQAPPVHISTAAPESNSRGNKSKLQNNCKAFKKNTVSIKNSGQRSNPGDELEPETTAPDSNVTTTSLNRKIKKRSTASRPLRKKPSRAWNKIMSSDTNKDSQIVRRSLRNRNSGPVDYKDFLVDIDEVIDEGIDETPNPSETVVYISDSE